MTPSAVPAQSDSERDLPTPRPADQHQSQDDSASPSPSGGDSGSAHGQRKSFSSLASLSTSYSSADEHSEVGELPADSGGRDVHVQTERQGSGHSGTVLSETKSDQTEGDIKALEKELADMNVKSGQDASNVEEEEDEDSYLNDPLVKYTLQLHDYTVSRIIPVSL
jgi:hypothetical protein